MADARRNRVSIYKIKEAACISLDGAALDHFTGNGGAGRASLEEGRGGGSHDYDNNEKENYSDNLKIDKITPKDLTVCTKSALPRDARAINGAHTGRHSEGERRRGRRRRRRRKRSHGVEEEAEEDDATMTRRRMRRRIVFLLFFFYCLFFFNFFWTCIRA